MNDRRLPTAASLYAIVFLAVLGVAGCGSGAQGQEANADAAKSWAELQAIYAYDHSLPLEAFSVGPLAAADCSTVQTRREAALGGSYRVSPGT